MKKNPDEITGSKSSYLRRLVSCVWHLGICLGWKYWKLQNACMVDPSLALRIAETAERDAAIYRAAAASAKDVHSWQDAIWAAEANEIWAARVRQCHAEYLANKEAHPPTVGCGEGSKHTEK